MELPDHFNDREIVTVLKSKDKGSLPSEAVDVHGVNARYSLTCGLIIKLRCANFRVVKRSRIWAPRSESDSYEERLYYLVKHYVLERDLDYLLSNWTPETIATAAMEMARKAVFLSPMLQSMLHSHPLVPLNPETGRVCFHDDFLRQVAAYHKEVERPNGTFSDHAAAYGDDDDDGVHGDENSNDDALIAQTQLLNTLASLEREECHLCRGRRQTYCGDCKGVRLPSASQYLPDRVSLPFDILLVLHWQETLHKCTGVQAAVLCEEGTVDFARWPKIKIGETHWGEMVASLDAERDVILFPSDESIPADEFPWIREIPTRAEGSGETSLDYQNANGNHHAKENTAADEEASPSLNPILKWRLVVLEASWGHGKTMFRQLSEYREERGLSRLKAVELRDITGEYWKFHEEGHSAVSTIEAIAHTARAAGLDDVDYETLLLLFRLQKHRVLSRVQSGGKAPKAVTVCGEGLSSWADLTAKFS